MLDWHWSVKPVSPVLGEERSTCAVLLECIGGELAVVGEAPVVDSSSL